MNKEFNKITRKQAYEAMIHLLKKYHTETGSRDLTDIIAFGRYTTKVDEPMDKMFKHWWNDIVTEVENGLPPQRVGGGPSKIK